MNSLAVVILAAGQGTRMNSKKAKIFHEVGGRPMIEHVFQSAAALADSPPILVIAPGDGAIRSLFGGRATFVEQPQQLGTGQATQLVAPFLQGQSRQVVVTYADMPLLRPATLSLLAQKQAKSGAAIAMLSVMGDDSSTFGRVLRRPDGRVEEILEVAEARGRPEAESLLAIRELNVGVYCFDAGWLWENIPNLPLRQARNGPEYYLTDMVGLAVEGGRAVEALVAQDPEECLGAGTRQEMVLVERAFRRRANARWLAAGVTIVDPESTYIDQTVTIGVDTVLWPNTYLQGHTTIGADCVLGPNSTIREAHLGDGCHVEGAIVENVTLPAGTRVPPFSYLSPGASQ